MANIVGKLAIHLIWPVIFLAYLPLAIMGLLLIGLKAVLLKLKLLTRINCTLTGNIGIIDLSQQVCDVISVSTVDELKFILHRSPLYIYSMTFGTAKELAKLLLGYQRVELVSNSELIYAILYSVFSHSIEFDRKLQMYKFKLVGLDNYSLYKGNFWEVGEIIFSKDCKKIKIIMQNGKCVSWPPVENSLEDWKMAKLHAQVSMTFYAPGLSHNQVHFVFPSAMIVHSKRILPDSSFLARLIAPHSRFTERINFQALNLNRSTDNKQTLLDKYYCLWKSIPINGDQFVRGVLKKCKNYYKCKNTGEYEHGSAFIHSCFPPNYVLDKEQQKIPYLKFLATYYKVVKNFVQSVSHLIDAREWNALVQQLEKSIPGITSCNMIDVVATFIHTVGVVHYCDHYTYLLFFARKFGCMTVNIPFTSWEDTKRWDEMCDQHQGFSSKQIKDDPALLLKDGAIMRTRCFLNTFVEYTSNPFMDLSLLGAKYDFSRAGEEDAVEAVCSFHNELQQLDKNLRDETPPLLVPAVDAELSGSVFQLANNMQLIPVKDLVASVCF